MDMANGMGCRQFVFYDFLHCLWNIRIDCPFPLSVSVFAALGRSLD